MNAITITSKENPRFRYLLSLHDRKVAKKDGVVFLEGFRLCEDAFLSGLHPRMLLFSEDKKDDVYSFLEKNALELTEDTEILELSETLFARICSTIHPQGIAMVVDEPQYSGPFPFIGEKSRYIVLESLRDPGNMGTIIRMADAFAYQAVIMTADSVDPYNEKVLRSSMGSCFHIPIIILPTIDEIILQFKSLDVQLVASHLHGTLLPDVQFHGAMALFIGNEAHGLTESCSSQCDILVKIPMKGKAESLNAASAASILGYLLASD